MASRRPTMVEQVRNGIRELISDGTYTVGDQLPNEQQMGERFGVSRATVREAYRGLIESGYLARRQGSGTFVARIPQQHALDLNLSYTEMIRAAGFKPSIVVLDTSVRQADDSDLAHLAMTPGEDVVVVERLRLADDRPVVYSIDRLPASLVPPDARGDGFGRSLFGLLEQVSHGARNGRARIKPVLASGAPARHLQVAKGTPLLFFEETDFDGAGRPVLASSEWHTSDVFDMWINRKATLHSRSL
ncbi:GntR family transcriptional regulator [Streptomyces sp. NPDC001508]|uniref:GntR family transcriptional regulator n=1 Tax=Streptomyces sp. NPDC001508 TaxID=3154656 RepID=UPI00332FA5D6